MLFKFFMPYFVSLYIVVFVLGLLEVKNMSEQNVDTVKQDVEQPVEQPTEQKIEQTEQPIVPEFKERTIIVTMDASLYNIVNKLTRVLHYDGYSYNRITDDVWLNFNTDGLTIRQMNNQHTTMINIMYPASSFSRYDVSLPMLFPFRQNSLIKKAKAEVTLCCTEQKDKWIYTIQEGIITSKTEVDKEEYTMPQPLNLNLPVRVTMQKELLLNVLRNKEVEYIAFEAKTLEEVSLTLWGDTEIGKVSLTSEEVAIEQIEPHTTEVKATYDARYIKDILQAVPMELIVFAYGTEQPCCISFLKTKAQIDYYIAPRCTED
jgi:hypothetical protein